MSRWSDEFDNHPIHQFLNQATEYLETEAKDTDAAFEDERRRITNVIGNLRKIVAGLDPEFYPKQWLDQIHAHYNSQVLNQLQAFSSSHNISNLRAANDQATTQIVNIYNLAAMSRQMESQEAISNAQKAFGSFAASMETTANKTEERFKKHEVELASISEKAEALSKTIGVLDTSAGEKLAEWQDDFTQNQTTRAEEHSEAQIEREKQFATTLKEQQDKFEKERGETVEMQKAHFKAEYDRFKTSADNADKDIGEKREKIREFHDLVTDETVTGGYHKNANDEGKAANFWRFASIGCLIVTAIWLGIKIKAGFPSLEGGGISWPDVITASSLTAIFLYAAGYTSRQSTMHRGTERIMRSYALETQVLDPFIASLQPEEQQAIKAEMVRRMFGQQNANGNTEPTNLNDDTVKTLLDKFSDTITDAVNKVVNKS